MKTNARKMNNRVTICLPRAMTLIGVFVHILIKNLYYNDASNYAIPETHAFSQQSVAKTRRSSFQKRNDRNGHNRCKLTPTFSSCDWKSWFPLQCSIINSAALNITEISSSTASTTKRGGNTEVRNIMSILENRYDSDILDQKGKTREWKKTRNYLYHATRSHQDQIGVEGDEFITFERQVGNVLDFLDERLDLPPHIAKSILQKSPRILRKPVDSFLIPTSDFLLQLWGRDLFVKAVERNPTLLLSSGVGYTTNRKSRDRSNQYIVAAGREKNNTNGTMVDECLYQNVEEILFMHTGLSSRAMKRIKGTAPFVFGSEPSKVDLVLQFLDNILREKLDDEQVAAVGNQSRRKKILGKMIVAHPHLLNLSVESNLKPRVEFLTESLDLDPAQVAKMVQISNGSVLSLSVERNLKPTLDFLLDEIFHDDKSDTSDLRIMLKKCVLAHPQLLALSLSNLKSKVNYFHSIGPFLALRVARKCPAIYSLNLEQNIIPTIEFLAKVWGVSREKNKDDFVSMLREYPNVITLSVETNLQPTMMFFNKTGYTHLNENWLLQPSSHSNIIMSAKPGPSTTRGKRTISNRIRGRHIAASLYNRLLPRWHYFLSSNLKDKYSERGTKSSSAASSDSEVTREQYASSSSSSVNAPSLLQSEKPPLHLLVMASDEAFCQAMDFRLETFLQFKKESIPRLKFSSQFDTWLKTGKPIDL